MNKVLVFNDNIHPLRELFKGEEVHIDAKDYWRDKKGEPKVIDIFEANDFRGQYAPVPFDGSGKMLDDARYFKKIKLEPVDEEKAVIEDKPAFRCMAPGCKHVSPSSEELEAHSKTRHATMDTLVLPEQDTELVKKSKAK